MTTADESKASPDAVSSTFGLPGGVLGTDSDVVLCESLRNGPTTHANLPVVPKGGKPPEMEERVVYRLALAILLLVLAILTDSRRLVDAAAFMLL